VVDVPWLGKMGFEPVQREEAEVEKKSIQDFT